LRWKKQKNRHQFYRQNSNGKLKMKATSLNGIPRKGFFSRLADPKGYLLSEVMIAAALFSIGVAAVGTLILSTSANNTAANILTQATLLAAERLENFKMNSVTDLTAGAYSDANNPMDARGRSGGIFHRSWIIEDPIGYDTARRIQVTVRWSRGGANRSVELTTITRGDGL
jgi:Tfp pilus assembly protein PilV